MQNDTTPTVHVALEAHKDSIIAAYSVGLGEVQNLGNVGVLELDMYVRYKHSRESGNPVTRHFNQLQAQDDQLRCCEALPSCAGMTVVFRGSRVFASRAYWRLARCVQKLCA